MPAARIQGSAAVAVASKFVDACKIDGMFTDSCAQRELACPLRPLLTRSVAWCVPHAHALNTSSRARRVPCSRSRSRARHLACAPWPCNEVWADTSSQVRSPSDGPCDLSQAGSNTVVNDWKDWRPDTAIKAGTRCRKIATWCDGPLPWRASCRRMPSAWYSSGPMVQPKDLGSPKAPRSWSRMTMTPRLSSA